MVFRYRAVATARIGSGLLDGPASSRQSGAMASRPDKRRFDALVIGESRQSAPHLLTEEAIIAFARQFDPQWFHIDAEAAVASPFGGLVASGVHLMALWRRIDDMMNADVDYYCGVELQEVRFRRPVRPGSSLTLHSELLEARPSASDPGRGLVKMAYRMTDDTGDIVLELTVINMVYR